MFLLWSQTAFLIPSSLALLSTVLCLRTQLGQQVNSQLSVRVETLRHMFSTKVREITIRNVNRNGSSLLFPARRSLFGDTWPSELYERSGVGLSSHVATDNDDRTSSLVTVSGICAWGLFVEKFGLDYPCW